MCTLKKILSEFLVKCFTISGALLIVAILMVKRDPAFDFLNEYYLFKTVLSVGTGFLLISGIRQKLQPMVRRLLWPLIFYGKLSYEIYLTHMFVVIAGIRLYQYYEIELNNALIWLMGMIVLSGVLGFVVERFYSKPMNLWIRRRALS